MQEIEKETRYQNAIALSSLTSVADSAILLIRPLVH